MTTTNGKRVPAEQRRSDLVDAAIQVVIREGVHAATTRRISAEAGCPLAAVHYAFRSKQELLEAVLRSIIDELAVGMERGIPEGADVTTALRASFRALLDVVFATPEKQLVTYELTTYALRHPEVADFAAVQYEVNEGVARHGLDAVATASGSRWTLPLPQLSRMLVNVVDGVVLAWLVDRDDTRARSSLDAYAGALAAFAEPLAPRRRKAR